MEWRFGRDDGKTNNIDAMDAMPTTQRNIVQSSPQSPFTSFTTTPPPNRVFHSATSLRRLATRRDNELKAVEETDDGRA